MCICIIFGKSESIHAVTKLAVQPGARAVGTGDKSGKFIAHEYDNRYMRFHVGIGEVWAAADDCDDSAPE